MIHVREVDFAYPRSEFRLRVPDFAVSAGTRAGLLLDNDLDHGRRLLPHDLAKVRQPGGRRGGRQPGRQQQEQDAVENRLGIHASYPNRKS